MKSSIYFYNFVTGVCFLVKSLAFAVALPVTIVHAQEVDFVWSKAMSGISNDCGLNIYIDSSQNVYVIGPFQGTVDFDPGPEKFNLTSVGYSDIFISKLSSNGDFVWAKALTISDAAPQEVLFRGTVDSSGNIYITGFFYGTVDFDPGPERFFLSSSGDSDIFICKMDSNGNFVWAKSVGGDSDDLGLDISLDSAGNIYTTGYFESTADFDPGPKAFNLTSINGAGMFISKLDSSGNLVWAKAIDRSALGFGLSIFANSQGDVYTAGLFKDTVDLDPGLATFNLSSNGYTDIFISKLDSNGNFSWAKSIGGNSYDWLHQISIDSAGDVYVTGYFEGTVDFDPGPETFNRTSAGGDDIFISKLDSDGNFAWVEVMGGPSYDSIHGQAMDSFGNIYITGSFRDTMDFDPGPGTFYLTSAGGGSALRGGDVFVSKLKSNGDFTWALAMGSYLYDTGEDIRVDSSGNIYITGCFEGTMDSDPGPGTFNLTNSGGFDTFIVKLKGNSFYRTLLPPPALHLLLTGKE